MNNFLELGWKITGIDSVIQDCPHCGREVSVKWDVPEEEDQYDDLCPYCGKLLSDLDAIIKRSKKKGVIE